MAEGLDICACCRFYKALNDRQGACRRRAPVLLDVSAVDPERPDLGRIPNYTASWPLMERSEWCGDFELKRGALN